MAEYDYFFRRKKTRLGEFSHRRVQRALSRSLSGYLGGRKRILEIGCGDGYFAEDCRERGLRWVGAEANRGQCRVLARRGFPVVGASVPPLPFRSRSFDVIYCSHLLEHIEQFPMFANYRDFLADPKVNICYGAPACIVVFSKPGGVTPDYDCSMAAHDIMLTAVNQGLGTCWCGFLGLLLNVPEVKREFGVPDDYRVVAPILIGRPQGDIPPVPKNPPEILFWQS